MFTKTYLGIHTLPCRIGDLRRDDLFVYDDQLFRFSRLVWYASSTGPNAGKTWTIVHTSLGDQFHFESADSLVDGVALVRHAEGE